MTVPDTLRDERARGFFHLDNEIIEEYLPKIGVIPFAVYACIVRHADREGTAFPSYSKLQKHTGCGRAQIAAAIKTLAEVGLIVISPGDVRTSNRYRIVTPSSGAELVPQRNQFRSETAPSSGAKPHLVPLRNSNNTHRTIPNEQDPVRESARPVMNGRAPQQARAPTHPLVPVPDPWTITGEDEGWLKEHGMSLKWAMPRTEAMATHFQTKEDTGPVRNSERGWKLVWQKWLLRDQREEAKAPSRR